MEEQQWYERNPTLLEAEREAMYQVCPDAKSGILPDGRMFWTFSLHPRIGDVKKEWVFLAVYEKNHPDRWGNTVRFYPVKPDYREMQETVNSSSVSPHIIPYTMRDGDGQVCLDVYLDVTRHANRQVVHTAASLVRNLTYWVNKFEYGLLDQAIWDEFTLHRHPAASNAASSSGRNDET